MNTEERYSDLQEALERVVDGLWGQLVDELERRGFSIHDASRLFGHLDGLGELRNAIRSRWALGGRLPRASIVELFGAILSENRRIGYQQLPDEDPIVSLSFRASMLNQALARITSGEALDIEGTDVSAHRRSILRTRFDWLLRDFDMRYGAELRDTNPDTGSVSPEDIRQLFAELRDELEAIEQQPRPGESQRLHDAEVHLERISAWIRHRYERATAARAKRASEALGKPPTLGESRRRFDGDRKSGPNPP